MRRIDDARCDCRQPAGGPCRPELQTTGLVCGYDGTAVVSGVELQVAPATIVSLIGPNGAGKSTLLRTIAAQQGALGGAVYLRGKRLDDMDERERAREEAILLTERPRTELLTCADVVEAGRYPHTGRMGIMGEQDRRAVRDAMELVGVWELRNTDFMRLSDGQRQRALLARAICQEPHLLLLDEPASYLDIRYQIELVEVLRTLADRRGLAIVMSMHDLGLARQASDWLVCVKDGGIVAQGTPDDIVVPHTIDTLYDIPPGTFDPTTGAIRLRRRCTPQSDAEKGDVESGGRRAHSDRS